MTSKQIINIVIITTLHHNIGIDFIREGVIYLLNKKFRNRQITQEFIHKYSPITVRDGFEWCRTTNSVDKFISTRIDGLLPLQEKKDKILRADLIVQSGTPIYWCHPEWEKIHGIRNILYNHRFHCHKNVWYQPLVKRRYWKIANRVPFINLAVGSWQKYSSDGSEFKRCEGCSAYIKELYSISKVTTLRDKLSKNVFNMLGLDAPLIPCTSIFARDALKIKSQKPEYIALNYMKGGGHYDFGQKIDFDGWENNFTNFYRILLKFENCVFVCHNKKEVKLAKNIDSAAKIFFASDYREYLKFYSQVKFGFTNRIHGLFSIASFGRPAVSIGNDSRSQMANTIGLTHRFVNDATLDWLLYQYELLINDNGNYYQYFREIKKKALNDYEIALDIL